MSLERIKKLDFQWNSAKGRKKKENKLEHGVLKF